MQSKIPATVITGFLGAGKTSTIRHLVENAKGKRLALLINEFGDLGVDRGIVGGCGIEGCAEEDVIELANGCICCTVADDFLPAMESILARAPRPDHIVIETSGLALPKPLVQAFNWPNVRNAVTVDGVLVVVDAEAVLAGRFAHDHDAVQAQRHADPNLDHESPLEELFEEQLACADMVLVNKIAGLAPDQRHEVMAAIQPHLRDGVRIVQTDHGQIDPAIALGLNVAAEDDLDSRHSHHDGGEPHDHDDFESFVVPIPPLTDPASLDAGMHKAARDHDILRIKGFLDIQGKPMRHVVQAVGTRLERYYDRPWKTDEPRQGRLVIIGQKGLNRAAIATTILGEAGQGETGQGEQNAAA